MVRLLQGVVGLSDEGGGPFDALFAPSYLLGQFPQPHSLGKTKEHEWIRPIKTQSCQVPGLILLALTENIDFIVM